MDADRLDAIEARLAAIERRLNPPPPAPAPPWRAPSVPAPRPENEPRICPACRVTKELPAFAHPEHGICLACQSGDPSGWLLERAKADAERAAARLADAEAKAGR